MHSNNINEVVKVCPLLLPADPKRLSYAGYISTGDHSFYLKIMLPADRDMKNARIDCDWKLYHNLREYEHVVKKRLTQSKDLPSFLMEFKSLLGQVLQSNSPVAPPITPPTYYACIIEDIEKIGWHRLSHIDPYFRDLKIVTKDPANREHTLSIHLTDKYPLISPVCNVSLPLPFQPSWSSSGSLTELLKQFEQELVLYQTFWDVLQEVDSHTWVLEPESPSFSCTYRRIVIGTNLSIQVTLDPLKPQELPECVLLGPDHDVAPLKNRFYSEMKYWDSSLSLLSNLRNILSIDFPSPSTTKKEEFSSECGVCYSHRHTETVTTPDITCNNTHCGQTYHHSCLYEWFKSLPTTRENFKILFGECPYCNYGISISSKN